MKPLRSAILALGLGASPLVGAQPVQAPSGLIRATAALADSLSDGYATLYTENLAFVEFHDSGWPNISKGAVVLFSMSGWHRGNTNSQIVAMFAANERVGDGPEPPPFRLVAFREAGGKGHRLFNQVSVANGLLTLKGYEYSADDPLCCPSRAIRVEFTLVNGDLREKGAT